MNPVAIGVLGVAAAFALADWISRARAGSPAAQRLEYVCKPATMVALIAVAIALDPAAGSGARRSWFVAALVFSLAGDVLLMLPREQFVGGLAAFLVAHCCYLAGFWTDGPAAVGLFVALGVVIVVIGALGTRILASVRRRDPGSAGPVAAYMVVIGAMLATALAGGNPVAGVGAGLFVASDSLIAWDRFVGKVRGAAVAIMVTYHLGQGLLVLSLLR